MKKLLSLMLVSALFLVACGGVVEEEAPAVETVDAVDVVDVVDVSMSIVSAERTPFSVIESSMLTAKLDNDTPDGYGEFVFTEGSGECIDLGFPAEFSYVFDEELGYNILDGAIRDESVGLTSGGRLDLINKGFTLDGVEGEPSCEAATTYAVDDVPFKCEVEDVVVCEATFKLFGVK